MKIMTPEEYESSKGNGKYVIMVTQGQGGGPTGDQFDTLEEANTFFGIVEEGAQ